MELAAVFVLVRCKLDLGNFETWTFHTSKPQNDSCLSNMFSNFWADSRAITENKCRLCETQRGSQRVLHWLYIGCDVRPRTNKKQKFSPTMFGPFGFLRASSPSFVTIPLFSTDQDIQAQKTELQKLLKPSLNYQFWRNSTFKSRHTICPKLDTTLLWDSGPWLATPSWPNLQRFWRAKFNSNCHNWLRFTTCYIHWAVTAFKSSWFQDG